VDEAFAFPGTSSAPPQKKPRRKYRNNSVIQRIGQLSYLWRTQTDTQTHRQKSWAIGNAPPLFAHIPYPFFEATPPGAAPGPPVKTGARVRRLRGCNKRQQKERAQGPIIFLFRRLQLHKSSMILAKKGW